MLKVDSAFVFSWKDCESKATGRPYLDAFSTSKFLSQNVEKHFYDVITFIKKRFDFF